MLVNKIYLYDDKMTVLCNTQDGHFDVDLKEVSSLKGQLVEPRGVEPLSESTFTVTSPGAVCLLGFPPRRAGKQARRFGRVMLHDGGNSYPVHVHH